jgi:hypothetical protein
VEAEAFGLVLRSLHDYLATHGPELVVELAGISISTLVGAAAAFWWERRHRRDEQTEQNRLEGRKAQVALRLQFNFFKQLIVENLRAHRQEEHRWRTLPRTFLAGPPERVNLAAIGYLVDTSPRILFELGVHDHRVLTAVAVLKERTNRYREFVRLLIESHTAPEVSETNNPDLAEELRGLTDSLYATIDLALSSSGDNYQSLTKVLASRFGQNNVLGLAAINEIDVWWEAQAKATHQ